jgi:uncharacterized protein (DUF2267 family)
VRKSSPDENKEDRMEYSEIVNRVERLDFITDSETADSAVKAVLGILTSRMEETDARKLTEQLPGPLTLDKLRGHQRRVEEISAAQYISEIGTQFSLSSENAGELVKTVLHTAKEATGDGVFHDVEESLPSDWRELIEKA